jgi:hypothetical protein
LWNNAQAQVTYAALRGLRKIDNAIITEQGEAEQDPVNRAEFWHYSCQTSSCPVSTSNGDMPPVSSTQSRPGEYDPGHIILLTHLRPKHRYNRRTFNIPYPPVQPCVGFAEIPQNIVVKG